METYGEIILRKTLFGIAFICITIMLTCAFATPYIKQIKEQFALVDMKLEQSKKTLEQHGIQFDDLTKLSISDIDNTLKGGE